MRSFTGRRGERNVTLERGPRMATPARDSTGSQNGHVLGALACYHFAPFLGFSIFREMIYGGL